MCKFTDAMSSLDKLEEKFLRMTSDDTDVDEIGFNFNINEWKETSLNIGTPGMLFSLCRNNDPNIIEGFSYLPKNTRVHEHMHEAQKEIISVISGRLGYEIFKNDDGEKEIFKKGVLFPCEKIEIDMEHYHILYTAEDETYLHVKFINVVQ